MYRREVTLQDSVVAVTLMECSMQSSALLGGVNILHSAFPASAEDEYALQGSKNVKLLKEEHHNSHNIIIYRETCFGEVAFGGTPSQ